jgi:hypothetical protein
MDGRDRHTFVGVVSNLAECHYPVLPVGPRCALVKITRSESRGSARPRLTKALTRAVSKRASDVPDLKRFPPYRLEATGRPRSSSALVPALIPGTGVRLERQEPEAGTKGMWFAWTTTKIQPPLCDRATRNRHSPRFRYGQHGRTPNTFPKSKS